MKGGFYRIPAQGLIESPCVGLRCAPEEGPDSRLGIGPGAFYPVPLCRIFFPWRVARSLEESETYLVFCPAAAFVGGPTSGRFFGVGAAASLLTTRGGR